MDYASKFKEYLVNVFMKTFYFSKKDALAYFYKFKKNEPELYQKCLDSFFDELHPF